jgi:paraquat-inducible protein B
MVRVRTPLIPQVQRLSELCRQGHTETVLRGLEELINAIEAGTAIPLTPNDSALLADVVARLERLESQSVPQEVSTVRGNDANFNEALATLSQRLDRIEKAIAPVIEALAKVPHVVTPEPVDVNSDSESELNVNAKPPTLEYPLSQRQLSERLGQRYPYYLKKHRAKGKVHFEVWSQSLDPDGVAWTFDEPKRHRGKASTQTLKFFPKR